jgi:glycosyltransferase involved in cell wall biosynthesis
MKVAYLMRRPRAAQDFSVELLFREVAENLADEFQVTLFVSRFTSSGLLRRVYNVVEAALRQQDVNHVTGDVNFLVYLLDKRRTILTVLDCGRIDGRDDVRSKVIRLLWFALPVRHCAAVTVISHAVKEQLLRHVDVDPDKVHVVPVPVPKVYGHSPKPFAAERPVILQIGAAANKNRGRLFDAVAGVPCKLSIVGQLSDEEKSQLERHDIEYENHVGVPLERMVELYASADLLAFPSTSEGFGMPIIEANLVGRAVVTGNVTSMPEVAGDAACLVDPFDVQSIRAGILRVIKDAAYRERLVANGFENAKRYNARGIALQYEQLYRRYGRGREA